MSLVRAEVVRVVEHRDTITVIGVDGAARRFGAESAELVRALLELVRAPIARDALRARVADLAGVDPASPEARVIDDALDALIAAGVIVAARAAPAIAAAPARARIVLGISGAVAAIDAPVLVRALLARGFALEIAATPKALRFVGASGLEALTHEPVHRRVWERTDRQRVPHVTLAEWADLVLVCPATATTLSRIAAGDCSDLVSAICVTTRAPVVLVPSMNDAMYESPSVQRNLRQLAADGMHVVHPTLGQEVAHAPGARRSILGPAPPARVILDVVELVLRTDPRAARVPELPASPEGWDAIHALPLDRLPWHTETLDPDLGEVLDRARAEIALPGGAPARLLDLGAGSGTGAIAAAARGFDVVATDISAAALARARRRAPDRAITWVLDDVRSSTVKGTFDVILDRACLHCLPREDWPAYASTVDRLAAAGGWLVIKSHAPGQRPLGTTPPAPEELAALLPSFELLQQREAPLPGPVPDPPRALVSLFRKRR